MRRSSGPFAAQARCRFLRPTRNFFPLSVNLTSTSGMSVRAGLPRMLKRTFLFLAALALTAAAHAQLTIDITTSGGRQIPIAIMPLAGETTQPQVISEVVAADLARTGLFRL